MVSPAYPDVALAIDVERMLSDQVAYRRPVEPGEPLIAPSPCSDQISFRIELEDRGRWHLPFLHDSILVPVDRIENPDVIPRAHISGPDDAQSPIVRQRLRPGRVTFESRHWF